LYIIENKNGVIMIKDIIDLLNTNHFYGVSDRVEIAKGKYEIPVTWKSGIYKIMRIWQRRKSK
jgi:hypothetical protein